MSSKHYQQISPLFAWSMCVVGAIFYSYEYLLRVAPSVMVPYLMDLYQINAKQVGILSAYYFYSYTPLQLVVGTLFDKYGVRKLIILAIFACASGAWFFGFFKLFWTAKIGRALIGFGSAFAFVGVMKIASDWLPSKWFGLVAGLTTALGMMGAIGGELVLSELIQWTGVRQTLGACIIFGVILMFLAWMVIRDPERSSAKANALNSFAELKTQLHLIIKNRKIWLVSTLGLCLFMPTTVFAGLWSVRFLEQVYHIGHHAGLFSSMIFLGWAFGGPIVGLVESYLGKRKPILIVGSAGALIVSYLIIYMPHHELHVLGAYLFLFGVFSSVEILAFSINHDLIPHHLAGTAVALTNMIVMCGGFVQPLIGVLLDQHHGMQQLNAHNFDAADYQYALFVIPFSFFISLMLSFAFKEVKTLEDNNPE